MIYPEELAKELRREFENHPDILAALDLGELVEEPVRKAFDRFNELATKGKRMVEDMQAKTKDRKEELQFKDFQETVEYWSGKCTKYGTLLQRLEALRVYDSGDIPHSDRRA